MIDPSKIKPVSNRVLVRPDAVKKESGGIIIPDSATKKPLTGEVLAIGNTVSEVITVGCRVMYSEHSGTEIGDGFLLMPEPQILCVIDK